MTREEILEEKGRLIEATGLPEEIFRLLNVVSWKPQDIQALLSSSPFPWWIAGGWSLDLFTGKQSRPHFDTDVAIARQDQRVAQQYLHGWEFRYAVPGTTDPVVFEPWKAGQILGREIHGSWARDGSDADSPWRFELLLHEIDQDVWSFRYFPEVQHPVKQIGGRTREGIPYLKPEIALLYKAVRLRHVDDQDFRRVLPHLASEQRAQITEDILRFSPQHPWLVLLK